MHNFFLFCIFLETRFLGAKNQFSPFFSAILSPIGLKIFLVRLQLICGVYFFFLSISLTNQIWQDPQNLGDPEMLEIFGDPQYFGSWGRNIRNFSKKKKYTPRLGPSTYSKNFSSNG